MVIGVGIEPTFPSCSAVVLPFERPNHMMTIGEGLEPSHERTCAHQVSSATTLCRRSNQLSYPIIFGEGGGNRTLDALIKSQVLYRLSYTLKKLSFYRTLTDGRRGRNRTSHLTSPFRQGYLTCSPKKEGVFTEP